ncbi:Carbonic anhydrase [Smittium culicis]|uniref:Carbonic anhydrase n=1 Tax=Smittium culicis TaxID=133412 RepID=A0A1R1Y2I9_9FUNG|nr:Carbonic anhydrase [Smittium culicis]
MYLNKVWANETLAADPTFFDNLILGQSPSIVYVGCSDSRVAIDIITESSEGTIFAHRNIANSVTLDDTDTLAVLQYAVEDLKVQEIVIDGHTYCGGINAVLHDYEELTGPLSTWLAPIKKLYDDNKATIDSITEPYLKSRTLSEMNVKRVVDLVNGLDLVVNARNKGQTVNVHGWIFLMEKGIFQNLNITRSSNL